MLVFEFDKKNAQKAKNAIRKGFSANGMELTENGITLDDKIQKKGDFKFKTVYVMFTDNQSAMLNVKLSQHKKEGTDKEETAGDVFEVKISSAPGKYKVLPIANQDDHEKAIAEIAKALVANRKKFVKASEAIKVTIPKLKGVAVSHKQRVEALQQQVAELDTQIAAVDRKIESQKEVLAEAVRQVVAKNAKEASIVFTNESPVEATEPPPAMQQKQKPKGRQKKDPKEKFFEPDFKLKTGGYETLAKAYEIEGTPKYWKGVSQEKADKLFMDKWQISSLSEIEQFDAKLREKETGIILQIVSAMGSKERFVEKARDYPAFFRSNDEYLMKLASGEVFPSEREKSDLKTMAFEVGL